jgi:hypothetical protein
MHQFGRADCSRGPGGTLGRLFRHVGKAVTGGQAACHMRHSYIVERLSRQPGVLHPNSTPHPDARTSAVPCKAHRARAGGRGR